MHTTIINTVDKMTRCEIAELLSGGTEVRIEAGSNMLVLQMSDVQMAALAQDINRHLDRQLAQRMRVVERQTAPVGGAAG